MQVMNWTLIEEPNSITKLPAGGYVVRITAVEDKPQYNLLQITYDIAEGEFAGYYSDEWGVSHPFAHQFSKWYTTQDGKPDGRFKRFLSDLETSNRGRFSVQNWTMRCNEQELVGLEIGAVIQKELRTKDNGDDVEYMQVFYTVPSQDVRNNDFKLPEVRDKRTKVSSTYDDYSDVPFGGPSNNAPSWA